MADISENALVLPTAIYRFEEEVQLSIDWQIPNFSSLKAQTAPLESDRIVVGPSAWRIRVYPMCRHQNKDAPPADATGVYLKHDHVNSAVNTVLQVRFEVSILDSKGEVKTTVGNVSKTTNPIAFDQTKAACLGYALFKHAQVWGENPTLVLDEDTLRIRVRLTFVPPKQTGPEPLESLQDKLCTIMRSSTGKDFVLVSADGNERPVHRAFLAANSEVFDAMLQADMEEAKSGRCQMDDVSGATMDILLQYMYLESVGNLKGSARDVLVAADKYQMERLKNACERILVDEITNDTVAELLLLADKVSAAILKEAALTHVAANLKVLEDSGELQKVFDDADKNLVQEMFRMTIRTKLQ